MINKQRVDPRVKRTREILKQAIIDLIKQKGYRNVAVTDIVELSEINRATFYAHFINKDDLMETLIKDKLAGLESSLYKPLKKLSEVQFETLDPTSIKFFQYILDHAEFFDLLMEDEKILDLENRIIYIIRDVFFKKVEFIDTRNKNVNNYSFHTYRAYGIYGLIFEWIKSGYLKTPLTMGEELITILNSHSPKLIDNLKQ